MKEESRSQAGWDHSGDPVVRGSILSKNTQISACLTSGDPKLQGNMERRNGLLWLCDNADDDESEIANNVYVLGIGDVSSLICSRNVDTPYEVWGTDF